MSDDSLQDMPEFGTEARIPLVVPDLAPVPAKRRCVEKNKAGEPCRVPPLKGEERCLGHAKSLSPELRDKWRKSSGGIPKLSGAVAKKAAIKSREDILGLLSHRLDLVSERYGSMSNPEVEDMICNICRTMAVVMRVEASEDVSIRGWRMKGTA
jgi:hypothetical protein